MSFTDLLLGNGSSTIPPTDIPGGDQCTVPEGLELPAWPGPPSGIQPSHLFPNTPFFPPDTYWQQGYPLPDISAVNWNDPQLQ
jgi:hypothetical protein